MALQAVGGTLAGIEEPVGARQWPALARIAEAVGALIILDESVTRAADLDAVPGPAAHWIVNVRVSKMGGLLRSLEVVAAARKRGLRIIVGAQVGETSVLTRAALTIATAAGDLLAGQEGAFGTHLLTADVCDPPLMFGRGGVLTWADHPGSRLPGFGMEATHSIAPSGEPFGARTLTARDDPGLQARSSDAPEIPGADARGRSGASPSLLASVRVVRPAGNDRLANDTAAGRQPSRRIETRNTLTNQPEPRVARDFHEWRDGLRTIEPLGAYRTDTRNLVTGTVVHEPIQVAELTATAFGAADVRPLLGRSLLERAGGRGRRPWPCSGTRCGSALSAAGRT